MFPMVPQHVYVCKPTVERTLPLRVVPRPCKLVQMACDPDGNCKVIELPQIENLDVRIGKDED